MWSQFLILQVEQYFGTCPSPVQPGHPLGSLNLRRHTPQFRPQGAIIAAVSWLGYLGLGPSISSAPRWRAVRPRNDSVCSGQCTGHQVSAHSWHSLIGESYDEIRAQGERSRRQSRKCQMSEVELYSPIKQFLQAQGFEVKGEIGACDIVAVRGDEGPIVVELKERLTLALILQGVDRLRMSDTVYIAFRVGKGYSASWRSHPRQIKSLLRRLGLGLLTVSTRGNVVPVLDPAPYKPRITKVRRERLLREFNERIGDPETGGSPSRKRLTAYRQDVLRCAGELAGSGALKVSFIRERTGVERAGTILRDNHYGWFDRVERGHYELSPKGRRELADWSEALEGLEGK